jgi:hypothetical protein
MCDYSLYTVKNRLASEADDLVLHRFGTGSLGFCAFAELQKEMRRSSMACAWASFVHWLYPRRKSGLTAVCVPPGARLLISQLPECARMGSGLFEFESVQFAQLSERSYAYRDALRFSDGETILLQKLPEGLRVKVMALSPEGEPAEVPVVSNPMALRL